MAAHRASELDLLNDEACAVWVEGEGASDLADFGASHGTRRKNEAAWAQWEQFAALVGFDPLLSSEQVRNHASEVGTLLATFLLYVYPKMKGKRGRDGPLLAAPSLTCSPSSASFANGSSSFRPPR